MTLFYLIALLVVIVLLIIVSSTSKEEIEQWFTGESGSSSKTYITEGVNANNEQGATGQTIIINQTEKRSNGIGTAGFVLALIALFLGWVPVLGWLVWVLGLIFSFAGIFKSPRGMAVSGLVISLIGLILLLVVFAGIVAMTL